MKRLILPLLMVGMLASCGPTSAPTATPTESPTTETPTTVTPVVPNHDITIDVPTDLGVALTDIADAKKGTEADKFNIYGIVAQFAYGYDSEKGMDTPVGFYIVDNTSSMYVYTGYGVLDGIAIGNAVLVSGEIAYFISQPEASAGEEIGYFGAQQLKAESVEVIVDGYTEIPDSGIEEKSIKELATTDFRENDLSGTIYRVDATVTYMEVSGTDVYYFNDPSMDYSIYTYSTISGREYSWLNEYVGGTYEFTIGVHSLRSRDEAWRCIPIEMFMEVELTDEQIAGHALDRLAKQFSSTYNSTTDIELRTQDEKLTEATVSYSTDSKDQVIKTADGKTYLSINSEKLGKFNLTITLVYKDVTYTESIEIEVVEKPAFDGITIAEVQDAEDGETVKIKGIYVRTAANVQGVYIADETGIIPVYYVVSFVPEDYILGEELVFEGTVETDFTNNGSHPGYKRLSNATLVSHDSTKHEWNKDLLEEETTIPNLLDGDGTRVGKIYKVSGKIEVVVTSFYSNIVLNDIDTDSYLTLYCGNKSQIAWLEEYADQEHDFYIFVRDQKGSKLRYEVLDLE